MEEEITPQSVTCSRCGMVLYQGIEPKPINEIVEMHNGKCPKCGKILNVSNRMENVKTPVKPTPKNIEKPSKLWYLIPILFNVLGGIIAYFLLKNKDKKFAKRLLIIGIVMFFIVAIIIFTLIYGVFYLIMTDTFVRRTSSIITLVDIYCTEGTINIVLANDGNENIPISSLEIFLNGKITTPSGCSGDIGTKSIASCSIGSNLVGNHLVKIIGPSNPIEQIVECG